MSTRKAIIMEYVKAKRKGTMWKYAKAMGERIGPKIMEVYKIIKLT